MALQPNSVTPYLRSFSVIKNARGFAAAASQSKKEESYLHAREPLKTTTVENVTVSSVETNKPISRLAVYFKAGSRYENERSQGVAHALKIYAGLGTSGASQFGITRSIDFAGGRLTCTAGREYIGYTLEATRNKIQVLEKFLQDASVNQAFKPWELKDHLPRLQLDRIIRPPEVRTLELLHKAAYRKGLGFSLYSPKYMVGKHDTEMLLDHVSKNFVEASVVGVGLPHEQVVDFAGRLNVKKGNRQAVASKFYPGAEIRKESGGELAYVALAMEGPGLDKAKDVISAALVHRALGSGPRTRWGVDAGKLSEATKVTPLESVATGFSANYSDTGLVGVFITATSCCIEQLTKRAGEILRSGSFNDKDVARAKAILKADIALALEADDLYLEEIGLQSLLLKKVSSVEDVNKLIDSASSADMNKIVKGGKLSMASYGNVRNVPYLDELN